MAQLQKLKPDDVPSPEMRKEIARALKQAAFDEDRHAFERVKAVEGMAVWGGNFSVPLLVELLKSKNSIVCKSCMETLAKLKDPRAIEPVASRLSDLSCAYDAIACLTAFGADAEEAVLKNFPKRPALADRSLDYLEKYGTKKSLPLLKSLAKSEEGTSLGKKTTAARKAIEKRGKK
jgi:hypothetical protein